MKRAILTLFLSAAVVILISAYDKPHTDAVLETMFPRVAAIDSLVPDDSVKGQNVIYTFWSSDDAESRIANMYYSSIARRHPDLVHIGVNFDGSQDMFREIVRRDRLDGEPLQFHVSGGDAADMIRRYGLSEGFRSYLVDSAGQVVARNPSAENIEAFISRGDTAS